MATSATSTAGTTTPTNARGRFMWIELMTTDPDAAANFYREVVGWGTTKADMPGMEYTMFTAGDIPVAGLMPMMPNALAMGAPPNWTAYVEVPNADDSAALAQRLGGKILVPATDIEGVGRFAVIQDPQGAVIAIITSATQFPEEGDPTPMSFSWHELGTSDLPAAIRFYEQLFGWTTKGEFDMGEMGMYHMFGRDRFTYGGMMRVPEGGPTPYWLHYAYVADSADAAAERAVRAGGKIMHGPMEVPGGDRVAILNDPQGAWFAVHSKAGA
jgi:uncharacterized protein